MPPPASTASLRCSRSRSSAGASTLACAAASSMASGTPSRATQIFRMATTFCGVSWKSGFAARTLETKRSTDGLAPSISTAGSRSRSGRTSGPISIPCSPDTRSRMRLVTSAVASGASCSSDRSAGAPSMTCSKLSTSSRMRRSRSAVRSRSSIRPIPSRTPSASAMAPSMSAGSVTGARSTNTTPPGKRSRTCAAASIASRLLPMPPDPVSVISRASPSSRSTTARSSRSRPTSGVNADGSATAGPSDHRRAPGRPHSPANRSASSVARSARMSSASSAMSVK